MSEQRGTLETFAQHFVSALEPLRRAVTDENAFRSLMLRLGWETAGLPPAYTSMGNAIADAAAAIKALSDDPKPAEITDLLTKTKTAYDKIRAIDSAPPGVDAGAFLAEIGDRLFEILLTDYLATEQTAIFNLLSALNVIELENVEPTAQRRGYVRTHFKWEEIPKIIQDPASLPARVYGWGTPDLRFHLIVQHVGEMLFALGFPVFTGPVDDLVADAYHDADTGVDETAWLLKVPFYYITIANKNLEAAFTMMELKGENGKLPGVIIQPEIPPEFPLKFHLAPTIDLRLLAGTNAASQFGILLRPGEASIKYPFQTGTAPPSGGIGAGFDFSPETPTLLFGAPTTTRLQLQGASIDFAARSNAGTLDVLLSAQLKGLALVLAGGDSDSFLQSLIGDKDSRIDIPLGIEWSLREGLHFSGSDAFAVTLHPGLRIGPVGVDELALRLLVPPDRSSDLALSAAVRLSGAIGPVAFVIDSIGFQVNARFAPGNLGPLDLQPGFKPPNGAGLAIDAEVVHGGGFLAFDRSKGQYSGAMFLEFQGGISVTALGMITTRMPDGSKGYSLIVIITAEGFTPVQLGYGFVLTGIGGLVAINRTFDETALRAGLKSHTLDGVMFPRDPIRNAPQILSNLNKVFPPAAGHYLFGPMVQISWGTPVLITADLGVVLELGARLRLLILAQVVAILPKRDNDLVRLQMDAIGVLDFDQGTAALDATLYDSRLLKKFVLTGDMAMRMNWEGSPNFALAIGGLHPAFNPPANFPKLDRITINLSAGDNPRVRCEAYFALTANTVQFGARLELYASASGFSIQGETGFDVLIQFDPFAFLADFYAQVQLKRGSTNLFKVRVEGALAGPRPLHIKGKATFEILWWDISIRIDKTLVEGEAPPPPQPIDVLPRLKEALSNATNWVGNLPNGQFKMVTLRSTPPASTTDVFLHPLGTLTVKQTIVPLDVGISRFGQAPPAGARRFTISSVSLGGENPATQLLKDFFAPAQFFEMTDDERLSRPSFESMTAGVVIGSDEIQFTTNTDDWLEVESIEFETITVDKQKNESRSSGPKDLYPLTPALLGKQSRYGAAGSSDIRRAGRAKYRAGVGKYQVVKEGWSIVATDNMTPQAAPTNYSDAEQALQRLKEEDPVKAVRMTILRLSELN